MDIYLYNDLCGCFYIDIYIFVHFLKKIDLFLPLVIAFQVFFSILEEELSVRIVVVEFG